MKTDEKYLSDEEILQLKGGDNSKNTNKADYCICDNKPNLVSDNKNAAVGCVCYCDYSIPPGGLVNNPVFLITGKCR